VKYHFEGKEKLISYGQCPSVSLASSREKHNVTLKQLAEGIDPMAKRREMKAATLTVTRIMYFVDFRATSFRFLQSPIKK